MEEIWKDIPTLSGYQGSNLGNIRSIDRCFTDKNGKQYHRKGKKLSQYITNGGYYRIDIKEKSYSVSNLIALAFQDVCGNKFEGAEIDHKNTIRTDNRPENLRWVDRAGNLENPITKQRRIESHIGKGKGSRPGKWIIKLSKNNEILHFYQSARQAERETGISNTNIASCCLGKRKTAGGFCWKYAI